MDIYKTKPFGRWAEKQGLTDKALARAAEEIAQGQVEATLGGLLYKKRVARDGQGKRGSYRTIVALRAGDKAFFLHGFDKGMKSNISQTEDKALKKLARELMGYTPQAIQKALAHGALIKVKA